MIQTLTPFVTALMLFAIPTTQAHSQVRATQIEIAAIMGDVEHLLQQIDLNDSELAQEETELATELQNTHSSQRVTRVHHRLLRKLPRAERMIEKQVSNLSDAEVAAELARAGQPSESPAADRENLKGLYQAMVSESLPQLAHQIVDAGGVIPFVLKSKKILKNSHNKANASAADPGNASFGKAGAAVLLGSIVLVTALGLLLGWVLILTVYFSLGLVAVIWLTVRSAND